MLIATGDAVLIEGNTWGDRFWGMVRNDSGMWVGENWLGRLLTLQRSIIRSQDRERF